MCDDGTYFGMLLSTTHIGSGISLLIVDCVACIIWAGIDYTEYDQPYLKSCKVSVISGDIECGIALSDVDFNGGTMGIGTAYLVGAVTEKTTLKVDVEITSMYVKGSTLWSGSKTIDIEPVVIETGTVDESQCNRVILGIYPEKREKYN